MKLRVGLALLSVLIVPVALDGQNPSDPPSTAEQNEIARKAVMKKLSEFKFPKVEIGKASVREALEFFATKTRFNMRAKFGDEGSGTDPPGAGNAANIPKPNDLPLDVPGVPVLKGAATTRITIHRRNMSAREFLDEVCKQSGLQWVIEYPGAIVITPKPK
jgi:hypothetical protein